MKTRFTGIRYFAAIRSKGAVAGALLVFTAFAFPLFGNGQSADTRAPQAQSTPTPVVKSVTPAGKTADAPRAGSITDVRVAPESARVTFTVSTDRLLEPQDFLLDNPARLVLDFPNTINRVSFAQLPVKSASVKRLRVQQFQTKPSPIARIVVDLEEGHGRHEITTNKEGVRLVFNGANPKPAPAAVEPSNAPAPPSSASAQPKPSRQAEPAPGSSLIPTASAATLEKAPTGQPRAPEPAAKNPAPAYAPARAEQSKPVPAPTPKPAAAPVQKTAAAPPKNNAPTPAEANLTLARVELPEAASVEEPKPLQAKPPAETPLVAALRQTSDTPLKMASPSSARFSGQPITLDLIDIPLVDFFRLMSEEGGINVVMDPGITGRVSIKVVKVPWDQIFEAVLVNHSLDKQVEGSVVRIARKVTLQEEARQQEALKKANLLAADLETRVKRLNYAKANSLVKALEDQKTVRGSIVVEDRTNSLVLTDLPSSITRLLALIEALDIPQPQVEIEARIVSATRNFARDIGIQFGFVQGNLERVTVGGPNTFGTIGGTRPSATPSSTYAAGSPSRGRGASDDSASESAAVSTGSSERNKGNYNVNLPATKAFGGIGISVGNIFDTFLLDAAITAGESKGLAKLISQPKVTAQNNSPAVITQGLRFPVPVIANNTVTVQFHNAALTLTVTPQITYEGNIVLDLKVENNTPDFANDVDGIPSIRTSESTTRVLVSDGGTTVIGGILTDDEATEKDQVPGLGSLPVIGNLFKRNAVSRRTQEVLFFVTPRIVK